MAWLDEADLDRVGCFKYSPVEGATANELPDPVPEEVKEEPMQKTLTNMNATMKSAAAKKKKMVEIDPEELERQRKEAEFQQELKTYGVSLNR